jgi:hypothetical protein
MTFAWGIVDPQKYDDLKKYVLNVYNRIKTVNTTKLLVFILLHVSVRAGYAEAKNTMWNEKVFKVLLVGNLYLDLEILR